MPRLEHLNLCVTDPDATAAVLTDLFGWQIRWTGPAKDKGYTVHVGTQDSYLALYAPAAKLRPEATRYAHVAGLNHIGITVDDLARIEAKVRAAGYQTHSHADYEPGERFYFDGPDGIEFEIVSYA